MRVVKAVCKWPSTPARHTQENNILNPNAETTSQCEKMPFSTRLLLALVFKIPLSFPDKNTILIQNVRYKSTPLPPP